MRGWLDRTDSGTTIAAVKTKEAMVRQPDGGEWSLYAEPWIYPCAPGAERAFRERARQCALRGTCYPFPSSRAPVAQRLWLSLRMPCRDVFMGVPASFAHLAAAFGLTESYPGTAGRRTAGRVTKSGPSTSLPSPWRGFSGTKFLHQELLRCQVFNDQARVFLRRACDRIENYFRI